MRKILTLIASAVLALAGCTPKDILITEPVDIRFQIDKVKGTKVFFTVNCENPNAYYAYFVANLELGIPDFGKMTDRELAEFHLANLKESYEIRKKNKEMISSIADVSCFRGNRSLREPLLNMDTRYRLIVFQVNPETFTVLGEIKGESFQTQSIDLKEFPLAFSVKGNTLTVTPPDNDRTYYWDFETAERIFDDYLSPNLYFYFVVDMYETYGFMKNVVCKGPQQRQIPLGSLKEDEVFYAVGAAYDTRTEAISSEYTTYSFQYKDGSLQPAYQ